MLSLCRWNHLFWLGNRGGGIWVRFQESMLFHIPSQYQKRTRWILSDFFLLWSPVWVQGGRICKRLWLLRSSFPHWSRPHLVFSNLFKFLTCISYPFQVSKWEFCFLLQVSLFPKASDYLIALKFYFCAGFKKSNYCALCAGLSTL